MGRSSGIGRAASLLFTKEGAKLIAVDCSDSVKETAKLVSDAGGTVEAVTSDAGSEDDVKAFIAKARCIRRHGVPSFPDPFFAPGGHGVGINLGPGLSGDSPAIRHAAKACAGVGAGIPGTET